MTEFDDGGPKRRRKNLRRLEPPPRCCGTCRHYAHGWCNVDQCIEPYRADGVVSVDPWAVCNAWRRARSTQQAERAYDKRIRDEREQIQTLP